MSYIGSKQRGYDTVQIGDQGTPPVAVFNNGGWATSWRSAMQGGSNVHENSGIIISFPPPVIKGTAGDDFLQGKNFSELFYGRGGDDTIVGAGGNDRLNGGTGDDLLVGGDGKDVFIFKTGYGHDVVRGFFEGDRIDLSKLDSISDFDDLIDNHAHQSGPDIVIDAGNGDSLIIAHGLVQNLEEADFRF